jgi:membrane-associated phospholipid phosphatase
MEQVWEQTWEVGLIFITWLQTTYPQYEGFFLFITNLGLEQFYLILFPLIFWCINKTLGKQIGYVFLFTVFLNAIFKQAFRGPRPFWIDPEVGLDTRETGYGVPSGHTQNATVIYFFLAAWIAKYWMWGLATFIVFLMAISRIYLGAHFIHDTIFGFLLGALTLVGYAIWVRQYGDQFGKRILGQRLLLLALVPLIMGIVFILIRLILGAPDMDVPWASYIPAAERSSIEAAATSFALLLGFGVGLVFEGSRIRFRADGVVWKRVVRYLLGIVVTFALWAGLDQIFPEDPLYLALFFRIVRYFIVILWISYFAPWLFVKLRLADTDPAPGINISMRKT